MIFLGNSRDCARFAVDLLSSLKPGSLSITITALGRSEVSYVRIVIDTSLEDIVVTKAWNYSWLPIDIWSRGIQAG